MTMRISRRALISAGVSLASPVILRARAAVGFDTDVIVVGAGAAGLAAAHELRRRKLSFVILEARDRIGGRTFTDRSLGDPFDAGALYIHWAERNPWREVAVEKRVAAVPDDLLSQGRSLWLENGQPGERRRGGYWQHLSQLFDTETGTVPDVSFIDRVADEPDLRRGTMGMARMILGEEPERVSSLDYARLWSGTDLVVPTGYGALVERFGADLPVRTGMPVTALDWSGQGVRAQTAAGMIRAGAAIVTVPVGVLQVEGIRFTPGLPPETRAALDGLGMGALTKIALRFEGDRFGLPANSNVWDSLGERAGFNFECWPFDRNIIIAYLGGDHAREVVGDGAEAAYDRILERLTMALGSGVRKAWRGGSLHAWMNDPWSRGCYSHAHPGHADARAELARPVGERIWFAGEATAAGPDGSFGAAMTAGGAFLAGVAAASAIARQRGL
jgi:monoamine oxidase